MFATTLAAAILSITTPAAAPAPAEDEHTLDFDLGGLAFEPVQAEEPKPVQVHDEHVLDFDMGGFDANPATTATPAAAPAAGAPAQAPAGAAAQAPAQDAWVKLCMKNEQTQNKEICLINHEGLDPNSGMVLITAMVRKVEGEHKQQLIIRLPTAYALVIPAGVQAKIDENVRALQEERAAVAEAGLEMGRRLKRATDKPVLLGLGISNGEQAATVLATVRRDNIEARGGTWPKDEEEAFKKPIREQYDREELTTPISTRALVAFMDNAKAFGIDFAISSFVNGFHKDERSAVRLACETHKQNIATIMGIKLESVADSTEHETEAFAKVEL